jgi:diacylglycerol kinase (ATP)
MGRAVGRVGERAVRVGEIEAVQVGEAAAPRRAVLLANPGARRGGEGLEAVLARLRDGGMAVEEVPVDGPEDFAVALRRAEGAAEVAIVAGGDGSLCLAAPSLVETGLTLGILPTGTANDLARTLGIPPDLEQAADIILAGHRRRIDLGSVNGKPFFNVASIGLSTDLARELSSDLKLRWGRLGYAVAAVRALARARRFTAWVSENGTSLRTRTMQIAVGNGRFYGGGTIVAAHAAIDDGHLDLYSLEMRTVWKLALMLGSFRSGEHGAWSEVTTLRGTEFEIRTSRPRPVNADGEIITATPAVFRVHPGAVEVLAPPA